MLYYQGFVPVIEGLIGEITIELEGKITMTRALPDGKVKTSEQGSGSILGAKATWVATTVSSPMPNGVIMGEGNGIITTMDGEVVSVRKIGIGWSTGRGRKASRRGAFFFTTKSKKFEHLNRIVGMYEFESDVEGNWAAKIWEWK
jgi:hypothetical protein